jgi:hypothetical protein
VVEKQIPFGMTEEKQQQILFEDDRKKKQQQILFGDDGKKSNNEFEVK